MRSSFILVVKANELFDDALSWIMYSILLTFFHIESDNFDVCYLCFCLFDSRMYLNDRYVSACRYIFISSNGHSVAILLSKS